ncbi:unnamed protein product [Calicophoron daubneyi]|uniref:Uncharacterized protein n=1 Tax=Calicophoron daubneyi TaxID=300641 RepID=A0AAV2TBV4_CALDB
MYGVFNQWVFVTQRSWWRRLSNLQRLLIVTFFAAYSLGTAAYLIGVITDRFHTVKLQLESVKCKEHEQIQRVKYNVTITVDLGFWLSKETVFVSEKDHEGQKERIEFLSSFGQDGLHLWYSCFSESANARPLYFSALVLFVSGLCILLFSLPLGIFSREAMITTAIFGSMPATISLFFEYAATVAYEICVHLKQSVYCGGRPVKFLSNGRYFSVHVRTFGPSLHLCMLACIFCFLPMTVVGLYLLLLHRKRL